jgi:hypothetical protein
MQEEDSEADEDDDDHDCEVGSKYYFLIAPFTVIVHLTCPEPRPAALPATKGRNDKNRVWWCGGGGGGKII